MFYKKITEKSWGKIRKKRPAAHDKPNFYDTNISFNLNQIYNNNSMANTKTKGLNANLNNLISFANRSW